MMKDLRDFIEGVRDLGQYEEISGADWDLEIGALTELKASTPASPLLMFDNIKGYPPGYRVAANLFNTPSRIALGLGLGPGLSRLELVKAFRERERKGIKMVPPVEVDNAPVKENVHTGDEVDLFEFPTPLWHEGDGGRYIGTGCMTLVRDPDEGWLNIAAQRVQIHDKTTATIYMAPGRHTIRIRDRYFARGRSCPAAVTCGQEPVLWSVAGRRSVWGISEYDWAGGIRGAPVEVTRGVTTDLLIPATAEIVLEGEIVPPEVETRLEGPFGEWLGYYASGAAPEPAFRVRCVMHRNNPIIQGNPPSVLSDTRTLGWHVTRAAILWGELERQLPGIRGVWMMDETTCQSLPVISLRQEFEGHAKQAAMIAAGCSEISSLAGCKFIIVVDDDIDPSNISEVLWALATRTDPEKTIDIIGGFRSTRTDPLIPPEQRGSGVYSHSIAIVIACKPYKWIKHFPPAARASPELLKKTRAKWQKLFD